MTNDEEGSDDGRLNVSVVRLHRGCEEIAKVPDV